MRYLYGEMSDRMFRFIIEARDQVVVTYGRDEVPVVLLEAESGWESAVRADRDDMLRAGLRPIRLEDRWYAVLEA